MTSAEQQSINRVYELLSDIRKENTEFKQSVIGIVDGMTKKVDAKHAPIYMEQDILSTVQSSINTTIGEVLKGYGSPLTKLITAVVESRSSELRGIITDSFDHVIRLDDFKRSIISAFSHKVAKSIISNNDGLFDKVSNELKQDAIFKSKMQIAVSNVVEQCLTPKALPND